MSDYVTVTPADAVPMGEARVFEVAGKSLAICHAPDDGAYYAVDNVCTHDDGPLGEGTLRDGQIECPRHGALFDVRTGKAMTLPAIRPVCAYPTRVVDGAVQVDLG